MGEQCIMYCCCHAGWYFEVNELILLEEEQARRALEEETMRMEEHARQRDQMIGGPPRGMRGLCVCVRVYSFVQVS